MQILKASRKKAKIKLSIAGSPGSGKTYSALLLAYGLCSSWEKICLIDTENGSASLYSSLGNFNVIDLRPPYSPEKFVDAIRLAETVADVIVLDSAASEWSGSGGCLEIHERETSKMKVPNSFMAWAVVSKMHQRFIDAILQSSCHVICCLRSKVEYTLSERNGKQVPVKLGMAAEMRSGFEYEVSIAFELDQQHKAFCSKDRTNLFEGQDPFVITAEIGRKILDWCNEGESEVNGMLLKIQSATSLNELISIFKAANPQDQEQFLSDFTKRRNQIEKTVFDHSKISNNGKINNQ